MVMGSEQHLPCRGKTRTNCHLFLLTPLIRVEYYNALMEATLNQIEAHEIRYQRIIVLGILHFRVKIEVERLS
jgi:hypothetical protein